MLIDSGWLEGPGYVVNTSLLLMYFLICYPELIRARQKLSHILFSFSLVGVCVAPVHWERAGGNLVETPPLIINSDGKIIIIHTFLSGCKEKPYGIWSI